MPKARILAVDDQRYFRELIEGLLLNEGYSVRTASSGEEALHLIDREDFDIIITDLVMPGIDGCELVETVKEQDPDQDIVMVTGVVDVKTAVEAMKQGATDYILKPFDRNTLTRSLDSILQRRRLREEHARLVAENLEYMEVLSLYERAAALFSTLSVEPLAERIVEGLCLETRAQGGVLWLVESLGEGHLHLVGARGLIRVEEEPEELHVDRLDDELRPLLEDSRSLLRPGPSVDGSRSAAKTLYVPIRHSGELLGVARLSDKLEGSDFDERDRAAAEKFVQLGALSVVNALRFRSLERRSFRDPTTKAYTRAFFDDVVRNEIQKSNRFGRPFSLVRVDVGALGDLRRSTGDQQVGQWLENVVHQVNQALRSTDLVAVENERRFTVLLAETDALGGAVLKERIRRAIERSGVLEDTRVDTRREITLAVATYPTDGTQVEALDRMLDGRLDAQRQGLLRTLGLQERAFPDALEALLEHAEPGDALLPDQAMRFLVQEVARRPRDRGLLVVSPGTELAPGIGEALRGLDGVESRIEVVILDDETATPSSPSVIRMPPERAGTRRPFLIYYGEGPAYALLTDRVAPRADEAAPARRPIFHTSDRALVEHLAFQLQRDLGIPLGA